MAKRKPEDANKKTETDKRRSQLSKGRRWLRDLLFLAGIAVVSMAARSTLADHYHVPSGSMLPTIEVGDRLLVNKLAYGLRVPFSKLYVLENEGPEHGDVVVLRSPEDGVVLLKRVAAVPGDEVEVRDGRLILNGVEVSVDKNTSPWVEHLGPGPHPIRITGRGGPSFGPKVLPARQYLVLGDNRGQSRDGRVFGLVERKLFLGRGLVVYHRGVARIWTLEFWKTFVWEKLH